MAGKKTAGSTATKKAKGPGGRPSIYSQKLADVICARLAEGESLRSICRDEGMPDKATVFNWMHSKDGFLDQYRHAKERAAEAIAEELFEIADDGSNDYMEKINKDGEKYHVFDSEHVQRSRLRIDTRKWYLERIAAKRYGSKVDMNHGIQEGNPLESILNKLAGNTLRPGDSEDS